jgi:predicted transcriptional regulator
MRFTGSKGKVDIERDIQAILKMLEEGPKSPDEIIMTVGLTRTGWNTRLHHMIGRGLIEAETSIKVTRTGRYKVLRNCDVSHTNSNRIPI